MRRDELRRDGKRQYLLPTVEGPADLLQPQQLPSNGHELNQQSATAGGDLNGMLRRVALQLHGTPLACKIQAKASDSVTRDSAHPAAELEQTWPLMSKKSKDHEDVETKRVCCKRI